MADILSDLPVHTVTDSVNVGERLKASCCGIFLGILLFLGSFPLLFWNEQRAVNRYNALDEAEAQIVSLPDPLRLNASNEGKLVHFTAEVANGGSPLVDPVFGVSCGNATGTAGCVALQRYSDMYQWKERTETTTKTTTGGSKKTTTNYYYDKTWYGSVINSGSFYDQSGKYKNPGSFDYPPMDWIADPMTAGAFELPPTIANWFAAKGRKAIPVKPSDLTDANLAKEAKATNKGLYFGTGSESNPAIGDEKVWFTATPAGNVTVVGIQTGDSLTAFVSETGKGGNVLLYRTGTYSAYEMFVIAEEQAEIQTWILRAVGIGVMALGQILVWSPLRVVADVIPILGSIVGCGITFISVTIALTLGMITISIAWLVARPIIGAIVLGVSLVVIGGCAVGVKALMNKRDAAKGSDEEGAEDRAAAEGDEDVENHGGEDKGDFADALDK